MNKKISKCTHQSEQEKFSVFSSMYWAVLLSTNPYLGFYTPIHVYGPDH